MYNCLVSGTKLTRSFLTAGVEIDGCFFVVSSAANMDSGSKPSNVSFLLVLTVRGFWAESGSGAPTDLRDFVTD